MEHLALEARQDGPTYHLVGFGTDRFTTAKSAVKHVRWYCANYCRTATLKVFTPSGELYKTIEITGTKRGR